MKKDTNKTIEVQTSRTKTLAQANINYLYVPEYLISELNLKEDNFLLVDNMFIYNYHVLKNDDSSEEEDSNKILLSKAQREYLRKPLLSKITVSKIKKSEVAKIKTLRISLQPVVNDEKTLNLTDLEREFKIIYKDFPFNYEQKFYLNIENFVLICEIEEILLEDDVYELFGMLSNASNIIFSTKSEVLNLTGNKTFVNLESLGIGGLSDQFNVMFRRAFIQRSVDTEVIRKMGIDHVKGIILHGPPGTGKTLIARKIGTLLEAKPPKIVNGPEILNKYVGQSEQNIRDLFKEAEEEYETKKEKSKLHIIIFDEIDAICKKRGSSEHGDQVVNQLLSKIDGVNSLDNILVIGMTNRIDLIDSALLRPGRFEIKIEVALPDEAGRYEIFKIHTKNMMMNNMIEENINLKHLAKTCLNYTGAEISALVKSAASFALQRQTGDQKFGHKDMKVHIEDSDSIKVTNNDFIRAISEIKPAFGTDDEDFSDKKIFYELPSFSKILLDGHKITQKLTNSNLYNTASLLLHGRNGVGKTTLAKKIAKDAKFSFLRIITPLKMVGMSEYEKINFIKETFIDAYRCEFSVVILDDLEGLVDFVNIGPRFSNLILQVLKIFIKAEKANNKIAVIGTGVDSDILKDLGLFECFDFDKKVYEINDSDFEVLVKENSQFNQVAFEREVTIKEIISEINMPDISNK